MLASLGFCGGISLVIHFAHLADVHLGAFRDSKLRELNLEAFKRCLTECIEARKRGALDFIVIAGDLFHVALPEMRIVDEATKAMKAASDAGLRLYLVYGSHDYSPTAASIIDVLASAGVLRKIHSDDAAHPEIVVDEATGALLAGACARSLGLEASFFEKANWSEFERATPPKIFVFHSAIDEHKPSFLACSEGIPLARFPKGCAYYAGGHVHSRAEIDETARGYGKIVFPGPLFAADYRDLEQASRESPGYYVVEISGGTPRIEFKPVRLADVVSIEFNAAGKSAFEVNRELLEKTSVIDAAGKIVLLRVFGVLREGKPSEVDFASVRKAFVEQGVKTVCINHAQLAAREAVVQRAQGASRSEIEERVFASAAAAFKTKNAFLKENSVQIARELLRVLSCQRFEEVKEKKADYEARLVREASKILRLV
ncbi:MAG: metallophosphoesterase [Candidatus Norongarragalinales archaeon]